ncbi:MAG TPA: M1 family metallopeptidase [Bryobacteraceae bacterium]|nr:M1 family metallopeptidase [Bryobacteraceae bacterium]
MKQVRRVARVALLAIAPAVFAAPSSPPGFRLPDDVVPLKHAIELSVDPGLPSFEGTATLQVRLRKAAAAIWVNGRDLTPRQAWVEFGGQKRPARVEAAGNEFLKVQPDAAVGPGPVELTIRYQAKLDDRQAVGAYRRKVDGEWYVYTTFTPIEARRAFPCFDEPRFKTPWEISIRAPAGNRAFSNGREMEEIAEAADWTLFRFAPTPPIASEVVAFAVGPFSAYEGGKAGEGTPVRVLTPRGRAEEGKAAAEATADVLPKLEAFTEIPYPFGKLDELAVADSPFGAVENPGLITYLAREFLIAPGTQTRARLEALRYLEAHELGHQWFGNLVTPASWADVWLSEGFATWISQKIMDQQQIAERVHLLAISERDRIMKVDDSPRARPVRVEALSREKSKDIYNRMVYDKGAAILLALEQWLGEDKVRAAARAYLEEHRFASASTSDFEADLRRASGVDPFAAMHALLDMAGTPRIAPRCLPAANGSARLEIRASGPLPVPVCWRASDGPKRCALIDAPARTVSLQSCSPWIYWNAGGEGYYRTSWTAPQLESLSLGDLTAAERLTLAQDLREDLRAQKAGREAWRAVLMKLAADHEPEVAAAAKAALK